MSAEKEGADKATDLLREMSGRIPTQGMGSDSYALLVSYNQLQFQLNRTVKWLEIPTFYLVFNPLNLDEVNLKA